MLSGNGRHRRPRQVPALVVAAGVTGSALAIPLLGATGASAADATVDANTWDRLADCESGGVWSADMGNGYYGGLQLTQANWEKYGGLKYAPSADLASRAQQVTVAEKLLADQGPLAWPTCGLVAGFPADASEAPEIPADDAEADPAQPDDSAGEPTEEPTTEEPTDAPSTDAPSSDDPSADVPPSDEPSSDPSGAPTAEPTADPSEGASDDTAGDTAGESGDKSHDASTGETDNSGQNGGGRHRGDPAPESPRGDGDDNSSGRHASRGDDSRGDADGTYTVRPGDNLSVIADTRGIDGGWAALYAANEDTVGADPDLILPGQRLDLGVK